MPSPAGEPDAPVTGAAVPSRRTGWDRAHGAWLVLCAAAAAVLVGVRWLRYTPWSSGPWLNGVLRELMVVDVQVFLWSWVYATLKARYVLLAAAIAVLGLHRRLPSALATRDGDRWRLRRGVSAVLAGALVWFNYLLDLNPTMGLVCTSSLLVRWLLDRPALGPAIPAPARWIAWGAFFAGWVVAAHDPIDRLAVVAWAITLGGLQTALGGWLAGPDVTLARWLAVIPANLFAVALPLVLPWHGGTRFGDGLAYSFCEVPDRGTMYATLPVCDSVQAGYDDCRDGRVVEYDLRTLTPVASHAYISPEFHGRLEYLECLDDEVHIGIQAAVIRGQAVVHSALAFPVAAPDTFNPAVAGPGFGVTMAYDRAREAIFYTSEFDQRIIRYDRRTQERIDAGRGALAHRWYQPVLLHEHSGSSVVYTRGIHPGRNRLYAAEWMHGRDAVALDLDSLTVMARYDVGGGGALGVTVDTERDRLVVSSVFGLEVFDLTTDTLVTRRRLGVGNRPAILDARRNVFYVPSTVDGKIRILDRDTFRVVGQIPIGIGTRYPHLSRDGTRLFGSSTAAHFVWDADTLVPAR